MQVHSSQPDAMEVSIEKIFVLVFLISGNMVPLVECIRVFGLAKRL